jgi:hypothetical protein
MQAFLLANDRHDDRIYARKSDAIDVMSIAIPMLRMLARVIVWIAVFEAKRPDRRHLRDIFARLCPMEVQVSPGKTTRLPGG